MLQVYHVDVAKENLDIAMLQKQILMLFFSMLHAT
jgi:hypothetical protein